MTLAHVQNDSVHSATDSAYELWKRGELNDHLGLGEHVRVEIIGGEIVVSSTPRYGHGRLVGAVQEALIVAKLTDPDYPWRCGQVQGLDLEPIRDGYIPDLFVLHRDTDEELFETDIGLLLPGHIHLAVEVTSPSTAAEDRPPGLRRTRRTKWNGYAAIGIPYYLLIDRDPKTAATTLYSKPDPFTERYTAGDSRPFGETIELIEPLGISVPTLGWQGWAIT